MKAPFFLTLEVYQGGYGFLWVLRNHLVHFGE